MYMCKSYYAVCQLFDIVVLAGCLEVLGAAVVGALDRGRGRRPRQGRGSLGIRPRATARLGSFATQAGHLGSAISMLPLRSGSSCLSAHVYGCLTDYACMCKHTSLTLCVTASILLFTPGASKSRKPLHLFTTIYFYLSMTVTITTIIYYCYYF